MANQRGTFAKRQREADLKEKARAKLARRMAKRGEVRTTKGPEMGEAVALDEPFHAGVDDGASDEAAPDDTAPPGAGTPGAAGAAGNSGPSNPTE